jgi:WhiB family transcriptional regulator, redox-sensing transcriptional regulator
VLKVYRQRWRKWAACSLETPDVPELWTPERCPPRPVLVHLQQICASCPVRGQCAADAVLTGAETGLYAGVWVPAHTRYAGWVAAMDDLRRVAGPGYLAAALEMSA